jgi:hypothetical protein
VIAVLLSFITVQIGAVWNEWSVLQHDLSRARSNVVIGYTGIAPHFSLAQRPRDWIHDEGTQTLLWGGWQQGVGHTWFRAEQGDIDSTRISQPLGRDVLQAIDYPLVELGGGTIWGRIPDESFVAGERLAGVETAYPILLLDKVVVVNDLIAERPFLVTYNPLAPPNVQITIYDAALEGRRVTMGLTGYFLEHKPLLYDRGTESLWICDADKLRAIAGTHKGKTLPPVGRPAPVSWSRWRGDHPKGRLIVGADRTQARPEL